MLSMQLYKSVQISPEKKKVLERKCKCLKTIHHGWVGGNERLTIDTELSHIYASNYVEVYT